MCEESACCNIYLPPLESNRRMWVLIQFNTILFIYFIILFYVIHFDPVQWIQMDPSKSLPDDCHIGGRENSEYYKGELHIGRKLIGNELVIGKVYFSRNSAYCRRYKIFQTHKILKSFLNLKSQRMAESNGQIRTKFSVETTNKYFGVVKNRSWSRTFSLLLREVNLAMAKTCTFAKLRLN